MRVCVSVCVHGEHDTKAVEPFENTINRMNHTLQQLRGQKHVYFSTHSLCIMSQAARGTLADHFNDVSRSY